MKLRRFISMMLIVTMLTVFAGCGNKDDRTQAARTLNLDGPITVNVWFNNSDYEPYLEFVAKQFKQANELVTINPVYVEADSYINYIYDESVRNDNACDLYFLTSEEIEKAYLMGLMSENDMYPQVYNEDVFGKAAMTACSYNGKLYGYPVSFNTSFLVYNKKYAEPVEIIDQIRQISDNYQVTDENQDVSMVFQWAPGSMFLNYPACGKYINIGGNNSEDSSSVSVDGDSIKKVLSKYAELNSAFGTDRNNTSLETCVDLFSTGNLLYTILDADSISKIDLSEIDYGICKYPSMGNDVESKAMSVTTMAVVNPYTKNVDASKAVARAISYDYADYMESTAKKSCARADIKVKRNVENYKAMHDIYSDSVVKAKYIGVGEVYMRYEIMLHQVYDGTNVDEAYNSFAACIDRMAKQTEASSVNSGNSSSK